MSDESDLEARLTAIRTTAPLESLPETASARARQLFRLYHPAPEAPIVRIARLVVDSFRGPAALVAVRGASTTEPRELLYEVGDQTLRLFQEPAGESGWYLIGQLIGADDLPTLGIAATAEQADVSVAARELGRGELHFESLAAGRYALQLVLPDGGKVLVPEVPVGEV